MVSARSRIPGIAASRSISTGRSRRSSGSPPGDPQLVDPEPGGDAHEAFDLFEIQDLGAADELHVRLRHAVEAADIAAVGDADAQVVVNAAERVAAALFDREHTLERRQRAPHDVRGNLHARLQR